MTFFRDIRLKRNTLNQKMVKLVDKMKLARAYQKSDEIMY